MEGAELEATEPPANSGHCRQALKHFITLPLSLVSRLTSQKQLTRPHGIIPIGSLAVVLPLQNEERSLSTLKRLIWGTPGPPQVLWPKAFAILIYLLRKWKVQSFQNRKSPWAWPTIVKAHHLPASWSTPSSPQSRPHSQPTVCTFIHTHFRFSEVTRGVPSQIFKKTIFKMPSLNCLT